jgi:hypothetical protein
LGAFAMLTRRNILSAALAAPTIWRARAAFAAPADATALLQRAIDEAQRGGRVVTIPAGVNRVSHLKISGDAPAGRERAFAPAHD